MTQTPRLCLVISTLGRDATLHNLFESLARQTRPADEIIIVDQNDDDRLAPLCLDFADRLPIKRIRTPDQRGLSRGRNVGWRASRADLFLFPDDDCWYPEDFLARALETLARAKVDILTGRAAAEDGRSINGRFEETAQPITRANVWTTLIEWVMFFRRDILERINGFDERIGIGAATPFQACEGQDAVLRALAAGASAYFDPALSGRHAELDTKRPSAAMRVKGRAYARGLGRVLRVHGYSPLSALSWAARAVARSALSLATGQPSRALYAAGVAIGRLEGYFAPV